MITDKLILWNTKYGRIVCNLDKTMKRKNISIYQLSRITNIRPDILRNYRDNQMIRYDSDILSKICYCLNCKISDIIEYVRK